jgi:hypothetical protein
MSSPSLQPSQPSSKPESSSNRFPPVISGPLVAARPAMETSTPTVLESRSSDPPPAVMSSSQGKLPSVNPPALTDESPPLAPNGTGESPAEAQQEPQQQQQPPQQQPVPSATLRNDAIYSMYTPAATIIDNIPPTVPRENAALIAQAAQTRQAHYNRPPGTQTDNSSPHVVAVHYKVGSRLGEGSFGVIYKGKSSLSILANAKQTIGFIGTNLLTNQLVAIKFEPRKAEAPQLRDEYKTYKILQNCGTGFQIFSFIVHQSSLFNSQLVFRMHTTLVKRGSII